MEHAHTIMRMPASLDKGKQHIWCVTIVNISDQLKWFLFVLFETVCSVVYMTHHFSASFYISPFSDPRCNSGFVRNYQ